MDLELTPGKPGHRVEDMIVEIESYSDRVDSLKVVLKHILENKIMPREKRMFETRGASSGEYYVPLRSSTLRKKRSMPSYPYPERPLWAKGTLVDSLTVPGHALGIQRVTDEGILFGTKHHAAEFHAEGTRNMPARPPVIIPEKHANEYIQDISDYIFNDGELK